MYIVHLALVCIYTMLLLCSNNVTSVLILNNANVRRERAVRNKHDAYTAYVDSDEC